MGMFKKLAKQLKKNIMRKQESSVSLPFSDVFLTDKNEYYKKLSEKALDLYERKSEIKKFTQLVLSDSENTSHNDLMKNLFESGVTDPFEDIKLELLADNQKFLRDLGLL